MGIYFPLLFVLMACFFLFIGVRVVLSKRPMFMPSRYFFAFMVLAFSPQFVNSANMLTGDSSNSLGLLPYLGPLMFVFLLIFLWFQMKGYMAIGVSDDSFREALHFSLHKNNLPFEERLSAMHLTSIDAILQVAIQSWMGSGQLKLAKSKDPEVLPNIVTGIREYYIDNNVKPNNFTPIFYIIMGVFMLVFAGVFSYVFSTIT